MKPTTSRLRPPSFTALSIAAAIGCSGQAGVPEPESAPPAAAPTIYGAGLFTTGAWDFFVAFSPDGDRALLGRADDAFEQFTLHETWRGADGRWSRPVRPRFATDFSDADPHFSPDGRSVYFISNRPHPGEPATAPRATHDIWRASLRPDGEWDDAVRLPAPVNDPARDEWSPSVAASGSLYFGGERAGTHGGSDLWVAHLAGGAYQQPENLGAAINSAAHEVEPWIAPDESYLIFSALRRADGAGGYDLFLSQRKGEGWEPARPLGGGVNTAASEWNHSVSPDRRWLHFTSTRRHTGDLGERFDHPRDPAAVEGIGDGKGDNYRVPMRALGL